jgi:hypothetical protein
VISLAGGGRAEGPTAARFKVVYWQLRNLKDAIRVLQLKEPVKVRHRKREAKVAAGSTGSGGHGHALEKVSVAAADRKLSQDPTVRGLVVLDDPITVAVWA